MAIYLHETVDMISGKWDDYVEGLMREAVPYLDQWKMRMCGFWQVNYSSGRWPEGVVIWELEDWETYTAQMKGWQTRIAPTEEGNTYYMRMAPQWRSGGFDRLLLPVSWSPAPPIRPAFKSSGDVFLHQTIKVAPLHAKPFLSAMSENVIPKLGDVGVTLEAFWRSVFDPLEYIGLYSVKGWDGYVRLQQTRLADDEGSQLPGLADVWPHITELKEKVLLATEQSPWGGGVPSLGSAL